MQNGLLYIKDGIVTLAFNDFGLATWDRKGDGVAHSAAICGTRRWMPPEVQTPGPDGKVHVGPKKDIWCFGMALAYMVWGSMNISWEDPLPPGSTGRDANGRHIKCYTCARSCKLIYCAQLRFLAHTLASHWRIVARSLLCRTFCTLSCARMLLLLSLQATLKVTVATSGKWHAAAASQSSRT